MDIRLYFNFFLLGLCLTTVLITLVTYIVFRLRNTIENRKGDDLHKLEGQFFKRFAPHLARENEEKRNRVNKKLVHPTSFKVKLITFSVVTFIFVITALVAEDYLIYRSELNKRAQSAQTMRDLISEGMLKTYEYTPSKKISFKEHIPTRIFDQIETSSLILKEELFILFSNKANQANSKHIESLENWRKFFERNGIKYKIVTRLYNAPVNAIWILPSYSKVLMKEKKTFEKRVKEQRPTVVTGLFGTFDLESKTTNYEWFEKIFGLKLVKQKPVIRPSQFKSKGAPLWDISPGLVLNWNPSASEMTFFDDISSSLAFEIDFQGNFVTKQDLKSTRFKFIDEGKKTIWLNHDPFKLLEDSRDGTYSELIMLSSLQWISEKRRTRVALWPKNFEFASVIAIDAEDKFSNVKKMIEDMKDYNIPATVFVVSDLYKEKPESLEILDSSDDLGSHTDNHRVLTEVGMLENFKRLENSRLDIEQIHHKKVTGFRPPQEKIDEDSLSVIFQNKFKYIFGDQKFGQYYPVFLADGELIYYPRVVTDDFQISRNSILVSSDDIVDYMLQDVEIVRSFGGGYFFSQHTHIFGEKVIFKKVMPLFYEKLEDYNVWKTNMKDINKWVKARDQIITSTIKTGNEEYLVVHNRGKFTVTNFNIEVEKQRGNRKIAMSTTLNNILKIKIDKLLAGEKKKIKLRE